MLRKDILRPVKPDAGTASPAEVARFSALAAEWWKPDGAFRVVHSFNKARLAILLQVLSNHFKYDTAALRPLEGRHVLDVGCGAGLVAEGLARLGATVVGIDASARNIEIARAHASSSGVSVDYVHTLPERIAGSAERFDLVLSFEVVEHVADLPLFLDACAALVAKDGVLAVATLNRTLKSFLFAIVGAELLRLLPHGTHDWRQFVTPAELEDRIVPLGFSSMAACGLSLNPITRRWRVTESLGVNYIQMFLKTGQSSARRPGIDQTPLRPYPAARFEQRSRITEGKNHERACTALAQLPALVGPHRRKAVALGRRGGLPHHNPLDG